MSKALSSPLGTHRARSEVKEGRCSVKKRKMLLMCTSLSHAAEKLAPMGLGDLGSEGRNIKWKKETGDLGTFTILLLG